MAIEIGNIPAFDNQPAVGIGIAIPFSASPVSGSDSIFKINYTTKDQIKSNIINYLLTSKGERIFNPNFGSNLKEFLFEPLNNQTVEILKKHIEDSINNIFPMVKLKSVEIFQDTEYSLITVQIFYSVFTSVDEFIELNIPL